MKTEEVVERLKDRLWGKDAEKEHNFSHYFSYIKNGYIESISLTVNEENFSINIDLWNSENDDREWIESINDYDDLFHHILWKYEKVISTLLELKKDLIQ